MIWFVVFVAGLAILALAGLYIYLDDRRHYEEDPSLDEDEVAAHVRPVGSVHVLHPDDDDAA